ncbi:hypothetical protein BH18ACT8_BH18ACT8_16920 [soil metagenome]
MARPFPFETPIAPDSLIDRRDELSRLHLAAADRVHVRVDGPRRFGKTSLLLAHAANLRGTGWRTVHVDLYGVTSLAEVCGRLASAYTRSGDTRVRAHVDALSARLGLSLSAGGLGISLSPRRDIPPPDMVQAAASELLDLPRATFERDRRPTLVVFDEFQDLLGAGDGLDGLVRSHVQYHADAAVYVYAGSHPSLMRRLFADQERPLYGQAEPMQLGLLPMDETLLELHERFAALQQSPGSALEPLVLMAGGHPQRTMLLAHLLHRELTAREGGSSTLSGARDVDGIALADAIVAAALTQTDEAHQAVWDGLSGGKKAVLAAIAAGAAPTGTRAAATYSLSRATLQSALRELGRAGQHLAREGSTWRFVDPLLRLWVNRRGQ